MINERRATIAKYRLARAQEILVTGESLMDSDLYSAANRLYYAIFCAMRAVLALESVDFKKHSAVISYFRQHYIKPEVFAQKYSELIGDSAQVRADSDYDDLYVPDRDKIAGLTQEAESFLADIERYVHQQLENPSVKE